LSLARRLAVFTIAIVVRLTLTTAVGAVIAIRTEIVVADLAFTRDTGCAVTTRFAVIAIVALVENTVLFTRFAIDTFTTVNAEIGIVNAGCGLVGIVATSGTNDRYRD